MKRPIRIHYKIVEADIEDLQEILQLQYLAYQSEAALFGSKDIPPLRQSLDKVIEEYHKGIILKMVTEDGLIIGSIRAYEQEGTVYIGKLMVHPNYRHHGYGTRLLSEIEKYYPQKRYELFTSTRSIEALITTIDNGMCQNYKKLSLEKHIRDFPIEL